MEADLLSVKQNIKQGDVAMMMKRLKVFRFTASLTATKKMCACPRCFSSFLLYPNGKPDVAAHGGLPAPMQPLMPSGASSSRLGAKRPREWSVGDVVHFLESCELGHLKDVFQKNGVDGGFLLTLSDKELVEELGLTNLQVKKIRVRLPQ